ncbi:MAG: efflux RND transporter periplasmic adaptor subunit [Pseudomonadota bacterium]
MFDMHALRLARTVGFLGALALVVWASGAEAQGRTASVIAERAELREITDTTPILGQVVATTESRVATRTAGIVTEVLFAVGDRVEAGQPLVRLDSDLIGIRRRTAAAALSASEAGVKVAEAQLRLAVQAFERTSQLRGSTAFSKGQFDDLQESAEQARSELLRSQAQLAQAEAELARADYDLRHATIKAPFPGVVIAKDAQPGSYIDLGEAVATLLDTGSLEIEVNLPARLVDAVSEGSEIDAELEGRQPIKAVIRSMLPVEAASTRTRPVRLSADLTEAEGSRLAAGKSVTLHVPVSAPRQALTVPKDALVQSRGSWMVFSVEDGKATPRQLRLGGPVGDRWEVLGGLLPGDVVVVRGNERLRPGQSVTARVLGEPEEAPEPAAGTPEPVSEPEPETATEKPEPATAKAQATAAEGS